MRSFTQLASAVALGVLTSTASLASSAAEPSAELVKTVGVALAYESAGHHSAHTATAETGKPVTVVFTDDGQQIKIHYVIDYNSAGVGHIISEIQSAPVHSQTWTPLTSYSAQFEYGKDFSISGKQTDGRLFSIKLHIAQNAAL